MSYRDTYFKLNWLVLNESGISKDGDYLTLDREGCEFLKDIGCPYTLAILIYMASHNWNSMIHSDEMYAHFFDDTRANLFYFEKVLERLIEQEVILMIE